MGKICCVTGHRPKGFPWDYGDTDCIPHQKYLEKMALCIRQAVCAEGAEWFIAGGALGSDTDFAETVLRLRDGAFGHIRLEVAVPCPNQDLKWNARDKAHYRAILDRADLVTTVSDRYTRFCMQKRNAYMVDKADILFAFWNNTISEGGTWNTIQYAERKGKRVEMIVLNDFL